MKPKLFDIHCHLNSPEFDRDREEVLARTLEADCWLTNIGADLASSRQAVEIARTREEGVYATVGFHPTEANDGGDEAWQEIISLSQDKKVVAIGECGLEYFRHPEAEEVEHQKELFIRHIELALALNKPLMIHCRPSPKSLDAYGDTLDILNSYKKDYGDRLRGDIHFFAGDWEVAKQCFDIDFRVSFTGVVTFTSQYDEIIKNSPENMIMAETDAPYVAPVPYRGKRCEPLYVAEVVKRIAAIRNISEEAAANMTVENAIKFYSVNGG